LLQVKLLKYFLYFFTRATDISVWCKALHIYVVTKQQCELNGWCILQIWTEQSGFNSQICYCLWPLLDVVEDGMVVWIKYD